MILALSDPLQLPSQSFYQRWGGITLVGKLRVPKHHNCIHDLCDYLIPDNTLLGGKI
jgi:hypothetical protein